MAEKKIEAEVKKPAVKKPAVPRDREKLQSREWCLRYANLDAAINKVPADKLKDYIEKRAEELFEIHGK